MPLNLTGCCRAMVNPARAWSVTLSSVMSLPLKITLPEVGRSMPMMSLTSVDFPLPLCPVMTVMLFSGKLRVTSESMYLGSPVFRRALRMKCF